MRKAVFTGTFDPFTIGHDSIVRRALALVDELLIGVVDRNVHKTTMFTTQERVSRIKALYSGDERIEVLPYSNLAVDFAKEHDAQFIIRGVRNTADFEYEKQMAAINKHLSGLETIFLFTEPEFEHVSSSMVRELLAFGKDITPFIPKNNLEK